MIIEAKGFVTQDNAGSKDQAVPTVGRPAALAASTAPATPPPMLILPPVARAVIIILILNRSH